MNVHFIQHEAFEPPGAYLHWAEIRKHHITFSKVYEGQALPETIDDLDMLIVMGGPQSPDTSKAAYPYFDANAEMALMQAMVRAGKPVVGICLGAQLLGQAIGANYEHSPEKEIGIFPVLLTEAGMKDKKIDHFGTELLIGHWHNDMPGLTPESKVLATSEGCPRQIIAYSDLAYGFQCHMEFTPEIVALMIAEEGAFLHDNTEHRFIQKPDAIRNYDFKEIHEKLYVFLDKLTDAYKGG